MEFNFIQKFSQSYNQGKETGTENKNSNNSTSFHIDCKYSKKKICYCKFYLNSDYKILKNDNDFSNFLIDLINDDIVLDESNKKINFVKKNKQVKFYDAHKEIDKERVKNVEISKIKSFLKKEEDINLSNADFKEIEKSINDDKKICENCKTNIYENNYHKGWKNEAGEFILLCPTCSKKYFSGALEIKFDNMMRKEEMVPVNRSSANQSRNEQINTNTNISSSSLSNSNPTSINILK
jgi:hypothetical protein